MADNIKELSSTINVDNTDYSVVAKKVDNSLTIEVKDSAGTISTTFNGSAEKKASIDLTSYAKKSEIPSVDEFITEIPADYVKKTDLATINGNKITNGGNIVIAGGGGDGGTANAINVTTDFGAKSYTAQITISKNEPTTSETGDIWFKY